MGKADGSAAAARALQKGCIGTVEVVVPSTYSAVGRSPPRRGARLQSSALRVDCRPLLQEFFPLLTQIPPGFSPSRACPSISRRPPPLDSCTAMSWRRRRRLAQQTLGTFLSNRVRLPPHSLGHVRLHTCAHPR